MNPSSDNSHYARRVVLPSGREIEVVYFDAQPAPADAEPIVSSPERDLHACPEGERTLVYPVAWQEGARTPWGAIPPSPKCRGNPTGVFDPAPRPPIDQQLVRRTEG